MRTCPRLLTRPSEGSTRRCLGTLTHHSRDRPGGLHLGLLGLAADCGGLRQPLRLLHHPHDPGRFRSRPEEAILAEAENLAQAGMKELIVVAQDITRYGLDLYGRRTLAQLLPKLCAIEGIQWVRLHYLYPDEITDELIDVIAREPKIVKYLDIPIQHISDRVLRAMHRRGTGQEIRTLFRKLRERIPGLVLRTSLIAGFPGETEEEFEELCEFLLAFRVERAGVFPYSPEPGQCGGGLPRPGGRGCEAPPGGTAHRSANADCGRLLRRDGGQSAHGVV